jgi:hypothetical protein
VVDYDGPANDVPAVELLARGEIGPGLQCLGQGPKVVGLVGVAVQVQMFLLQGAERAFTDAVLAG